MTFLEQVKKALTPELFAQMQDMLGDEFDWDLVPRSRLNTVIKQRNELRAQISGGTPGQSSPQPEPDTGKLEGTPSPVDEAAIEQKYKAQADAAVKAVKIQYAALEKLRAAGCIAPEMVFSSNAIDKTKLDLDATESLTGMDEIIEALTKSNAALFSKPNDVGAGTGKDGGGSGKVVSTCEDFLKLSTSEQIAFKQSNPALFKTFFEQ